MDGDSLPLLIVITHLVNLFCVVLLIRSGLHILADHPLLYWSDDTRRDNYWLKFGRKRLPKGKLWTSHDEAENVGHYALPGGGHREFGMARNWHLTVGIAWIATGAVYVGFLFMSGEWQRLIPTSWDIVPRAWADLIGYLHFQIPPESAFQPYDALQQLAYAGVVFVLAPLMILTALAMSPAFTGRFPGFLLLFGGRRQAARSLHFLGMVGFLAFGLVHVSLVTLVYFSRNVRLITFGTTHVNLTAALVVFLAALVVLLVVNVVVTYVTLNHRVAVRRVLVGVLQPVIHGLFGRLRSHQRYTPADISPSFRVNGYPPETKEFQELAAGDYQDWRLTVSGLVDRPLELSLADLTRLPKREQITKHICIQGWSAVGEWGGVPMSEILTRCQPSSSARYVVFHGYDVDATGSPFYEVLRLEDMNNPQTILAYEMNWKPLPREHGAPLRLRVEHKLGYKMVKYLKAIEFVDDYTQLGQGRGGYREDTVMFDWDASI